MAYERANGPLGDDYTAEMLASIQEQLQNVVYVTGAGFGNDDMPKPQRVPRKAEAYIPLNTAAEEVDETDGTPVGDADELNAYFDALEKEQQQ